MIREFRQKSNKIKAIQFTGDNHKDIETFTGKSFQYDMMGREIIKFPEHGYNMYVEKGDWVIDQNGMFQLNSNEAFLNFYEPVQ